MEKKMSVAALVCVTFLIGCGILSAGLGQIAKNPRTVSVRGLAEREVDADTAVWKLSFSVGGNDLPLLKKEVLRQTEIVCAFLKENGLDESDFSILSPEVNDASMSLYVDPNRRIYQYISKNNILVRSSKISAVKEASSKTLELIGKGVSVCNEYDNRVSYEFNGLNEIKPEMIAQATKNARLAAEQFARDSGSKVGKIMNATQGLFSIDNAATGLEDKKNVRVVTTVVYSIRN